MRPLIGYKAFVFVNANKRHRPEQRRQVKAWYRKHNRAARQAAKRELKLEVTSMGSTNKLTDEELASIRACRTGDEWTAATKAIKAVRDGRYPDDWYDLVIRSGLMDEVAARWGGDSKIRIG